MEPYRPLYHFTPPQNFMNDPNGLVYFDGEYHLFYQYNPFGDTWGHMSWGHAVSPDGLRWQHLPVALHEEGDIMIFSGSAVVDWHNTTGFGTGDNPPLVAIYTGHGKGLQTQNIAFSLDRGRTWTKYERLPGAIAGNPVLDIGSDNFRDPKLFWHAPTNRWVMVTALAMGKKVRLWGSPDMKTWQDLSDFGPAGATGGMWECPDLFELPVEGEAGVTAWVLKVDVNPGGVAGGSGGQYFVGQFDGTMFTPLDPAAPILWLDYGKDFYAAQSWSDTPGKRRWLGWMNNWQYANLLPTHPWRGTMTVPREIALKRYPGGLRLVQKPIKELQTLRTPSPLAPLPAGNGGSRESSSRMRMEGEILEIIAEFELETATEFGFKLRQGTNQETLVGYDVATRRVFVDRTQSGNVEFEANFSGRHTGPLEPNMGRVRLHILVDRCSVEVFGGDGQTVITDLIFPDTANQGVSLFAHSGPVRVVALDIWKLQLAW